MKDTDTDETETQTKLIHSFLKLTMFHAIELSLCCSSCILDSKFQNSSISTASLANNLNQMRLTNAHLMCTLRKA